MILGFDTATADTSVAVWAPGGPAVERRDDPAPGERPTHAARLLALVEETLAAADASWDAVERLAVGVGPGGFTGLRIGIATARALAQARGLPLVGRLQPRGARRGRGRRSGPPPVVAVIDARRGEVFAASAGAFGPLALAPEALAARIEPRLPDRRRRGGTLSGGARTGRGGDPGGRVPAAPRERAAGVPARRGGGAGRPRRPAPGLPPRAGRQAPHPVTAPPAAAVEIRRLTYADLPQVVAIERRAFTTPWSLAMFVLELSKPSGVCLAAEADGELVGYLVCSRYDTVWHVMNVAVEPDRLRRGIASALIGALIERIGDDAQLTLEVRKSNHGALALYERFGFRAAGVRRRYYADNGEDAVIMWRTAAPA